MVDVAVEFVNLLSQIKLKTSVDMVQLLDGTLYPLHLFQLLNCDVVGNILLIHFNLSIAHEGCKVVLVYLKIALLILVLKRLWS